MPKTSITPKALTETLSRLAAFSQNEKQSRVEDIQELLNSTALAKSSSGSFDCPLDWNNDVVRPLSDVALALFLAERPDSLKSNSSFQFMYLHSNFIQFQLEEIFYQIEGAACSADKARTIIKASVAYWLDEEAGFERIMVQAPEYARPQIILKDKESAVDFINAIHALYYGRNEQYLRMVMAFLKEKDLSNV